MTKQRKIRNPDIRVENSAPSQRRSAFSMRWSAPLLAKEGVTRVADIGSGTLRNLRVKEQHFEEIAVVETDKRCEILRPLLLGKNHVSLQTTKAFEDAHEKYDAIFIISVLHTVPAVSSRQHLVDLAVRKVRLGGFIVVDVPQSETYYNRRRLKLQRYKDGFLLRWGGHFTFYKNFYKRDLDAMFLKHENLQLFRKIHYCKHLIRIWKKTG